MEYLREQPILHLVDRLVFADTYVADIMQPRPPFEEIINSAPTWAAVARKQIQTAMERKNCPITWVQVVFDQAGMLLLLRAADAQHLGNIRSAAKAILKCLPPSHRQAAQDSLRPLDEVDRNRIVSWQTLSSMRPPKRRSTNEHDTKRARTDLEGRAQTVAEFIAELSESDSEDYVPQPLTLSTALALTDDAQPAAFNILDPNSGWSHTAKNIATLVLVEVGLRPARIAFTHCHRESRRQILLLSKLPKNCDMAQTVVVAMRLVKDGSLPPLGERGRKVEFFKRCAEALQTLDPSKETDVTRLSDEDQARVRRALSGDTRQPYDGCLTPLCLDEETTWTTLEVDGAKLSRCAQCKCPKAFGRSIHSIRDIIGHRMTSELGRVPSSVA